jgi:hypothetical protein
MRSTETAVVAAKSQPRELSPRLRPMRYARMGDAANEQAIAHIDFSAKLRSRKPKRFAAYASR